MGLSLDNKMILYEMVCDSLVKNFRIPRGYSKSPIEFFFGLKREAIKRTNYILAAIDEKLW